MGEEAPPRKRPLVFGLKPMRRFGETGGCFSEGVRQVAPAVGIAAHGKVEFFRERLVKLGQIGIAHNLLPADEVDPALNKFHGYWQLGCEGGTFSTLVVLFLPDNRHTPPRAECARGHFETRSGLLPLKPGGPAQLKNPGYGPPPE